MDCRDLLAGWQEHPDDLVAITDSAIKSTSITFHQQFRQALFLWMYNGDLQTACRAYFASGPSATIYAHTKTKQNKQKQERCSVGLSVLSYWINTLVWPENCFRISRDIFTKCPFQISCCKQQEVASQCTTCFRLLWSQLLAANTKWAAVSHCIPTPPVAAAACGLFETAALTVCSAAEALVTPVFSCNI